MAFQTTVWSEIRAARGGDRAAADALSARYRPLLLAVLTRRGVSPSDAEDLTQEVLLRLFAQDLLERVDPAAGRFRDYLLAVTRRVLSEQRRREGAAKRGGDRARVELTEEAAWISDEAFADCWRRDLLQRALDRLRAEQPERHAVVELRLVQGLDYDEVAARLDKPVEHVRVDLHRARKRLVRLIEEDIARDCASPEEAAQELAAFVAGL